MDHQEEIRTLEETSEILRILLRNDIIYSKYCNRQAFKVFGHPPLVVGHPLLSTELPLRPVPPHWDKNTTKPPHTRGVCASRMQRPPSRLLRKFQRALEKTHTHRHAHTQTHTHTRRHTHTQTHTQTHTHTHQDCWEPCFGHIEFWI